VNDVAAIAKAVRAARHPALLMVDTVASLGCMEFDMDGWGLDVAMAGSQKGLMAPPGLGFAAANGPARAVRRRAGRRTPYWACAPTIGTGRFAKARSTTRSTAARRPSTCCSHCARRSI